MRNEQTALLSDKKSSPSDNAATKPRLSRYGLPESTGVRPSRNSIVVVPEYFAPQNRNLKTTSSAEDGGTNTFFRYSFGNVFSNAEAERYRNGGGGNTQRGAAKSFMKGTDGSISSMTPLEMGRQELYEEIPFIAVPGLQKKERALSAAFSSFAAGLDIEETDAHLVSTTGTGLKPKEKVQRLIRASTMMLNELDVAGVTMPLVWSVILACVVSFLNGYTGVIMNPAESVAFPGHSLSTWSFAVSAMCVGGPFGAALAGKWAESKGRRGALLLTSWLFVVGGLVQTLAPTLPVMVLGRGVVGLGCGAASVLVPIYMGEVAPPNLRGVIGTMTQFALVIGLFFGSVVGFPLANESKWRGMFLLGSIIGACPLLLQSFLLESPRWLLGRDVNSEEARFVIKKLRGYVSDEQVETEVKHYVGASRSQSTDGTGKSAMRELFADKKVRLLLVSSLVLQCSVQFSGINAVFYYSNLFFDGIISNPLMGTTIITVVNVLATYVALLLMDRCGRRTLIMYSSGGMFLSCILIVVSMSGDLNSIVSLAAVGSFVSFFAIGIGPIPSLIVAEMFDAKYVTAAMSISSQLNWVCNFLVSLVFPHVNEALGPYCFSPFAVSALLTFLFAWIWLPETQGTTPAELQAALTEKNAGVTYHNMDIEANKEWTEALSLLDNEDRMA